MTASTRNYYGPIVLADEVGLARWQFERAEAAGMLPKPGHTRGWLPEQLETMRQLVPVIVEKFGAEHPVGAARCADRLAERLGLDVDPADISALAEKGHLAVADVFYKKGRSHDLYAPTNVDALTLEQVQPVLDKRATWLEQSLPLDEAAESLAWHYRELNQVITARGLTVRLRRIARADVDTLAGDEELRVDRLVTADNAAAILEHRAPALRHLRRGRLTHPENPPHQGDQPLQHRDGPALPHRRRRSTARPAGRELARDPRNSERHTVPAAEPGRRPRPDPRQGHPRVPAGLRRRALDRDVGLVGPRTRRLGNRLGTHRRRTSQARRARRDPSPARRRPLPWRHAASLRRRRRGPLRPRHARTHAAVILDTETTDLHGAICEIAVIDACTGKTLLDTLVNPGVPIQPGAFAVHGITDSEVTAPGIPDWATVYKRLLRVTKDRIVLAYNADDDRGVVTADCHRHGIRRTRLADLGHWADVMVPRSDHAHSRRWLRNGGGHRALGDLEQTRQHLLRLTAP
ncbi:hypothetical protein DMH01_15495 [Amycolatopsis sp. WAC 04182]|uniref:3'-5' exonuclease n=1 Tax=Amycolatopsis sp. WAC 04182 TaxID=2203198 RepID=UPI000F774775|nr:3'-5' exonuclease [Amycolatopsis sp. WAC 04182]RSN60685.1 hypothetical protein DMH01_15495 [Amycolatopsis sp. WAC 04182]